MIRSFMSEITKLRRRATVVLLGVMAAMGVLVSGFSVLTIGKTQTPESTGPTSSITRATLSGPRGLATVVGQLTQLIGVVALAAAASIVATEYAHGTWRNLLVRQPRRMQLLAGKILAIAAYVLSGTFLAVLAAIPASWMFATVKDVGTAKWISVDGLAALAGTVFNVTISALGFAAVGLALAVALRSPVASVGAGLAYIIAIEGIVTQAAGRVGRWLPGQIFNAVATGGTNSLRYATVVGVASLYIGVAVTFAVGLFATRELTT
jgi:ABC-2 type transport system permease protein